MTTTATMIPTTTDAVMALIQHCEGALRRLGLEADTWPLQMGAAADTAVCIELGFAKVDGAWHIATRRALYDDRDLSAPVRADAPVPLVRDTPARKAAAVELIPDLVREVAHERIQEVQAIERACLDVMPYR